jgi:hypothetical protein
MPPSRVARANAAVEEAIEAEYSDEGSEELDDDDAGDNISFGSRVPIPMSHNRSLKELHRTYPQFFPDLIS